MQESIEKKRMRLSPLFSSFIIIFVIYGAAYSFLRFNHDIVHVIIEKNIVQHKIMANMPMEHKLYLTTLVREKNSENVDQKLQEKINFHERKKKYLDIFFYPAIETEKMYWKLFYQKESNMKLQDWVAH